MIKFQNNPAVPPLTRLKESDLAKSQAPVYKSLFVIAYARTISQVQISVEANPNIVNRPKFLYVPRLVRLLRANIILPSHPQHLLQLQFFHIMAVGICACPFGGYDHDT